MEGFSRRKFLKGGALMAAGAAAAGLMGCSPNVASEGSSAEGGAIEWDEETDVVVAGSGAAGLAAAIEALQAGASVTLYESQSMLGGSTALNGGLIAGHGTRLAKKHGINLTTEDILADFELTGPSQTAYSGEPIPGVLKIVGERGGETIDWLEDMGCVFQDRIGIEPDYTQLEVYHYGEKGGSSFTQPLTAKVEELGGTIVTEARVCKLHQNEEGRVIGVAVDMGGKKINVKAKKGVVLGTGGNTSNPQLLSILTPQYANLFSCATPGAQGDAIVMGTEIQAATRRTAMMPVSVPAINMETYQLVIWSSLEDGGICLDLNGNRFVDEGQDYISGEVIINILKHFKETGEEDFWMLMNKGERTEYSLSVYPAAMCEANTIEELAQQMEMDVNAVKASVEKWNACVEAGVDEEFGRKLMMVKIDQPPFVACKVRPSATMTCGGLEIDTDAHVLKWAPIGSESMTEVIPALYAAGEATGWNARGGWTMNACFTMGRIAGQNVAAETPWE